MTNQIYLSGQRLIVGVVEIKMKAKHVEGTSCPSCDEKLLTAHPDLREWFNKCVKPKFTDAHISWSFRDKFNQNQCVAEGKSKLKWPLSAHNKTDENGNPCAHALDLFELCSNGMARWSWKYFKEIAAESKAKQYPVDWGHDLWGWDDDHFQLKSL
jgi:hypothetical protein